MGLSCLQSYLGTRLALPVFFPKLLKANLSGADLNKASGGPRVPEAGGLVMVVACCSALALWSGTERLSLAMLAAGLLGFADNVLNLEWRWKIIIPPMTLAPVVREFMQDREFLIPLQGLNSKFGSEAIKIPPAVAALLINMFSVYAQNAVNIYAGINGLEVGQSLVAQISLLCGAYIKYGSDEMVGTYRPGLLVCLLFVSAALPLFMYNKYPARVFVGDVFTYFAGCTYVAAAANFNCLILAGFLYFM